MIKVNVEAEAIAVPCLLILRIIFIAKILFVLATVRRQPLAGGRMDFVGTLKRLVGPRNQVKYPRFASLLFDPLHLAIAERPKRCPDWGQILIARLSDCPKDVAETAVHG